MDALLAQADVSADGTTFFGFPSWLPWLVAVVAALLVIMRIATAIARALEGPPGTPKHLRGEAAKLARRNENDRAGDLYRQVGDTEAAVEQYKIAGFPNKAADTYAAGGMHEQAAPLYERSQMWEPAAESYRKAQQWKKAEACYLKAGKKLLIGRMYEDAQQHQKAAQYYKEVGRLDKAADLLEKCGRDGEAAELLEKSFFVAIAGLSDKKAALQKEDVKKAEERVVSLYRRADMTDRAVDFYMRAGLYPKAAELCLEVGRPEQAIELYIRAGNEDRAAQLLDAQGEHVKASRLRGEVAMRRGELFSAARHYEEAGEMRLAASAYVELNQLPRAAELYEKAGDPGQSAHLFAKAGDLLAAAERFERAGDLEAALKCYETLKDTGRRAQVLLRAGKPVRAAAELLKAGKVDDAVAALQRVEPASVDSGSANALLGVAFLEKGMAKIALEKLEMALSSGQPPSQGGLTKLEVQYYRARALETLGEPEKALRAYETVVTLDANFRDALHRVSELQERISKSPALAAVRAAPYSAEAAKTEVLVGRPGAGAPTEVAKNGAMGTAGRLKLPSGAIPAAGARSAAAQAQAPPRAAAPGGGGASAPQGADAAGLRVPQDPRTPAPGHLQHGRYRIMEEIGRGGMGVVYKCTDTLLDRIVAYKVLSSQIRDFPAALENFLREAKSAARLHHPNIVTLFDFGESENGYYMTLEYVAGKNLRQFMKLQPEKEAIRGVLLGICQGLAYAHSQQVVHRDIKPSNILISDLDQRSKILDFGLAKILEDVSATASGVLGTPWYMSPEQVLGTQVDHRSDVYSFGVTLFEVLSGELPFKGRDFGYHHVHTIPPSPHGVNPRAVSDDMDRIILRCMEKAPEDRFPDASALGEAIQAAVL